MEYLVHVSHDAENLQFWLWLQDYIKRFFAISRSDQALSPPWNPNEVHQAPAKIHDDVPKAYGKSKLSMAEFLASLDSLGGTKPSTVVSPFGKESTDRTSLTRTVTESVNEANAQAGLNWQACRLVWVTQIECSTDITRYSHNSTV